MPGLGPARSCGTPAPPCVLQPHGHGQQKDSDAVSDTLCPLPPDGGSLAISPVGRTKWRDKGRRVCTQAPCAAKVWHGHEPAPMWMLTLGAPVSLERTEPWVTRTSLPATRCQPDPPLSPGSQPLRQGPHCWDHPVGSFLDLGSHGGPDHLEPPDQPGWSLICFLVSLTFRF